LNAMKLDLNKELKPRRATKNMFMHFSNISIIVDVFVVIINLKSKYFLNDYKLILIL